MQTRSDVVKVSCDEQWFCDSPNSKILGMEHRNISVLDETLSQVTNNLRGDTITFQHKGGTLYNLVVIMYKKTVNYINSTVSTTKKC